MQIETLKDVIVWTQTFHQYLSACTKHCASKQLDERAKLLLEYLSEHEQKLVATLKAFETHSDAKALNTWCQEYLNKRPIKPHGKCSKPFARMSPDEVMTEIEHQHRQIIDLYRYLATRDAAFSTREMLEQLINLEQHEVMRMVHGANRINDL